MGLTQAFCTSPYNIEDVNIGISEFSLQSQWPWPYMVTWNVFTYLNPLSRKMCRLVCREWKEEIDSGGYLNVVLDSRNSCSIEFFTNVMKNLTKATFHYLSASLYKEIQISSRLKEMKCSGHICCYFLRQMSIQCKLITTIFLDSGFFNTGILYACSISSSVMIFESLKNLTLIVTVAKNNFNFVSRATKNNVVFILKTFRAPNLNKFVFENEWRHLNVLSVDRVITGMWQDYLSAFINIHISSLKILSVKTTAHSQVGGGISKSNIPCAPKLEELNLTLVVRNDFQNELYNGFWLLLLEKQKCGLKHLKWSSCRKFKFPVDLFRKIMDNNCATLETVYFQGFFTYTPFQIPNMQPRRQHVVDCRYLFPSRMHLIEICLILPHFSLRNLQFLPRSLKILKLGHMAITGLEIKELQLLRHLKELYLRITSRESSHTDFLPMTNNVLGCLLTKLRCLEKIFISEKFHAHDIISAADGTSITQLLKTLGPVANIRTIYNRTTGIERFRTLTIDESIPVYQLLPSSFDQESEPDSGSIISYVLDCSFTDTVRSWFRCFSNEEESTDFEDITSLDD